MKRNSIRIVSIISLLFLLTAFGCCIPNAVSYSAKLWENTVEPYFFINDHKVTRLEYDFYFDKFCKDYVKTYSGLFEYMGVDAHRELLEQQYNEEMTYREYLSEGTKDSMIKIYALCEEGRKNGFSYDTKREYRNMLKSANTKAKEQSLLLREYLKQEYGPWANEINLQPIYEDLTYALRYNESLYANIDEDDVDARKAVYDYVEGLKEGYEIIEK